MARGLTDEEHRDRHGHLPEYRYETSGGKSQRACKICQLNKQRRQRQDPEVRERRRERDREAAAARRAAKQKMDDPPKLNRSAREHERLTGRPPRRDAPKIFDQMLDDPDTYGKPNCDGQTKFVEYDSEDPDQPDPPSLQMAQQWCEGCPLRAICLEATLVQGAARVYHGVYASGVYENGKRLK